MKKIKFALQNIAILALLVSSFIACDKDFNSVGSDIIGDPNFINDSEKYEVTAYTNPLEPVQTNNLPLNYLGAYNDPLYGLTTASFVSQLSTAVYDPDFGGNAVIDSVVLTIPYFSRRVDVNAEGETIYQLDSIFGDGSVKLEIFENAYFLSNFDPSGEFDDPLVYFSDATTSNGTINQALLEGTPIPLEDPAELDVYQPSNEEIKLRNEDDEVTDRLAPALRIKLAPDYWTEKILDKQDQPELSNANNFNNYFRGVYFKVTPINNDGTLSLLNFAATGANITIHYTRDGFTEGGDPVQSTYVFRFSGNRVNFLSNDFNFPQGDPITGDEKLYLKGGKGATAVIDLFNSSDYENGFSPEFLDFKNDFVFTDPETGKFIRSKRLVNEAHLVFYVDQAMVNGKEPDRLYLYDLNNSRPLFDYVVDATNNTFPSISKAGHLGILEREGNSTTGQGIKYKMRVTEHINNLLLRDSTNVKLGLAVSLNVNLESTFPQYELSTSDEDIVNKVPVSAILSPRGTVLYGNNTAEELKKLYLEIFYTEPNN